MEEDKIVIREKLAEVALLVKDGKNPSVPVRDILWWVLAYRRGWAVVKLIRDELERVSLKTVPDFESAYIDASVHFEKDSHPISEGEGDAKKNLQDEVGNDANSVIGGIFVSNDPTLRVSKLKAATIPPISVTPDASLERAITLMLSNGYSQLPVMTSDREVKGIISWFSIATRLTIGKGGTVVRDFMEPHQEIRANSSIFTALSMVNQYDYVLVRGDEKKITGIITATDLNYQFQELAEPFLLVGEIENQVRRLLYEHFSELELEAAKNPADTERKVSSPTDLTFGEYIKLLEKPANWEKMGLKLDRTEFIAKLEQVRQIRNDVMHFDTDPVPQEKQQLLRDFAQFLQRIHNLR